MSGRDTGEPINLHHILTLVGPYSVSLAVAGVLMVLETGAGLAVPWLAGRFLGNVLSRASASSDWILPALICLFALQALLRFAKDYVSGQTSARMVADLTIGTYDHLQSLPLNFFHQRRHGDVLGMITYEIGTLSEFITGTLLSTLPRLLMAMGSLILMYRIDATLAAMVMVLLPLFYLILKVIGRRLRPLAGELQQEHAKALATADENLGLLPLIKAFTGEPQASRQHSAQVQKVMWLTIAQYRIHAALDSAVQFVAAAGVVVLLWLASGQIASVGPMTTAEMISFFLYATLLTTPISSLASVYGRTQSARGSLVRLFDVLNERPETTVFPIRVLPPMHGDIAFEGVSFSYPDRPAILESIDLRIAAGETVGITGRNGAGKSTLVHLLLRLSEPQAGRITIDGTDIATIELPSLRRQIGIVSQHVLLFNASVRDNIIYGNPSATEAAIEAAARMAQAHAFIIGLPSGYETLIGDNGVKLSGGQRQRVALARALIKEPPILVLDEATAMFDPLGEQSFIEDCYASLRGRTVILITHRPASLALADRVVRLEGCKIVESERETASAAGALREKSGV